MRRARLLLPLLIVATLVAVLAAPAVAAPLAQATDTPTPTETTTPTATATAAWQTSYTLDSGNVVVIERRATFGELVTSSLLIVLIALTGLRWLYQLAEKFIG
jgi:hypothetical protein